MDTRGLGMAVVGMGGGRRVASDSIDYAVGLSDMIRLGDEVYADTPLAMVHARTEAQWQEAAKAVRANISIADTQSEPTPEVYRRIGEQDV